MKKLRSLKVEEKLKLYEKVKNLREKGLSYKKIAEKIAKDLKIKIDPTTISAWYRNLCKPAGASSINLQPSPEFSYFLGALIGDGNIRRKIHNYHYTVRLRVQDKDFAILFAKAASKIVNKKIKIRKEKDFTRCGERFLVAINNKRLWEFLRWKSLTQLIEIGKKFPAQFLKGLFDAEGSSSSKIQFSNTSLLLVREVSRLLKNLQINCRVRLAIRKGEKVRIRDKIYTARKNIYVLTVSKKADIQKFVRLIGFGIKRKQRKAMSFLR